MNIPMVGTKEFYKLIRNLEKEKGEPLTKQERKQLVKLSHDRHADAFKAQKVRTHSAMMQKKIPRKIKTRNPFYS